MTNDRATYNPDAPLRLDVAAKIAFPDGTMGAPGLRKERDKGRLVTEMIAGKEYTTLNNIAEMRKLCRVVRGPKQESSPTYLGPGTSSRIEGSVSPRDAVAMHLKMLKDNLPSKRDQPPKRKTPPRG